MSSLTPLTELTFLRFDIMSLGEVHGEAGSYTAVLSSNAINGIVARLDWCAATLRAAGEGNRNMQIHQQWVTHDNKPIA